MMRAVLFLVAALIASSSGLNQCSMSRQFLTFTMPCDMCSDPLALIDENGNRCCLALQTPGSIVVSDSTESCCELITVPTMGVTVCTIKSSCYERHYGTNLNGLSLYLDGVEESFALCNELTITSTPAFQTSTLCANCTDGNTTTVLPPPSSTVTIVPSFWLAVALSLWSGLLLSTD